MPQQTDEQISAYFDVWKARLRDDRTAVVAGSLEPLRQLRAWRLVVVVLLLLGNILLGLTWLEHHAERRALDARNAREVLTDDREK